LLVMAFLVVPLYWLVEEVLVFLEDLFELLEVILTEPLKEAPCSLKQENLSAEELAETSP